MLVPFWRVLDDSEVWNPGYCIAWLRFSMLRRYLAFRPDTIPAVNMSGRFNCFGCDNYEFHYSYSYRSYFLEGQ